MEEPALGPSPLIAQTSFALPTPPPTRGEHAPACAPMSAAAPADTPDGASSFDFAATADYIENLDGPEEAAVFREAFAHVLPNVLSAEETVRRSRSQQNHTVFEVDHTTSS